MMPEHSRRRLPPTKRDAPRAGSCVSASAGAVLIALLAGFVLISLNVEIDFIARATPFILEGIWITLIVSAASIVLATLPCSGRRARTTLQLTPIVNAVASFYVSFFRGTPLILQLLVWYLALPQVGHHLRPHLLRHRRARHELRRLHDRDLPRRASRRCRSASVRRRRRSACPSRTAFLPHRRPTGVPHHRARNRQRLRCDVEGLRARLHGCAARDRLARAQRRPEGVQDAADVHHRRNDLLGADDRLQHRPESH